MDMLGQIWTFSFNYFLDPRSFLICIKAVIFSSSLHLMLKFNWFEWPFALHFAYKISNKNSAFLAFPGELDDKLEAESFLKNPETLQREILIHDFIKNASINNVKNIIFSECTLFRTRGEPSKPISYLQTAACIGRMYCIGCVHAHCIGTCIRRALVWQKQETHHLEGCYTQRKCSHTPVPSFFSHPGCEKKPVCARSVNSGQGQHAVQLSQLCRAGSCARPAQAAQLRQLDEEAGRVCSTVR